MAELYPWGGDFTTGNPENAIAVVLLNISYTPPEEIAIHGHLKTENIGIEKIIANVISNPWIRYIIICGEDIRGHKSGQSLIALHEYGIDENHRIISAPGAIPYIENIDEKAVQRFQNQVKLINRIGCTNAEKINKTIQSIQKKKLVCYGDPFIAIRLVKQSTTTLEDKRALHSKITIDYMGKVKKRR